jgi:hypothetical protein
MLGADDDRERIVEKMFLRDVRNRCGIAQCTDQEISFAGA